MTLALRLKRAGGSVKEVATMTVFLTDPRQLDPLAPIFREFFPDGNFPAKTTVTVSSLAVPGMMLEITAVAGGSDSAPALRAVWLSPRSRPPCRPAQQVRATGRS